MVYEELLALAEAWSAATEPDMSDWGWFVNLSALSVFWMMYQQANPEEEFLTRS